MINQLKTIAANMARAASLLEQIPSSDKGIENVINENAWSIKQLEAYSAGLVENIELTSKLSKV